MSGGSLDYSYGKVNMIIEELRAQKEIQSDYVDEVKPEIDELIKQLEAISNNLHELEWYLSGDIGLSSMRKSWISSA